MLDYVVYWIFGIVFCVFTCRYCKVWRSMRALDPYRNGPWNILRLPDIYVAMLGQIGRQGFFEFAWVFNNMCLKGNATCNCIYVYMLQRRTPPRSWSGHGTPPPPPVDLWWLWMGPLDM